MKTITDHCRFFADIFAVPEPNKKLFFSDLEPNIGDQLGLIDQRQLSDDKTVVCWSTTSGQCK